ncbi:hypothetical protein VE04_09330 [Pseudogymnoascus sp. 24MN13]|nr:hypothetical protein VE04_09330 [Pseudogymnoascus sp. 24MN13]
MISFVNNPGVGASAFHGEQARVRVRGEGGLAVLLAQLGDDFRAGALGTLLLWDGVLRQGDRPSHFTFRRWQASQARLTEVEVVVVVGGGAAVVGVGGGGAQEPDEAEEEEEEEEGVAGSGGEAEGDVGRENGLLEESVAADSGEEEGEGAR